MDAGKRNRGKFTSRAESCIGSETPGKAFSQSAGVALPVQEAATQEEIKTDTVGDIVQSLPSFTETRANGLILPSLHMANRELRRAKSHVQKWSSQSAPRCGS